MSVVACDSEYSEGCRAGPGDTVICDDYTPPALADPQTLPAAYVNLSPAPLEKNPHPYVTGKIVIVDKKESGGGQVLIPGKFNSVVAYLIEQDGHGELLAELQHGINVVHPEEVGTVVWLECSEVLVGNYNTGASAYRTDCTATVIDKANNVIVGKDHSRVDPPKEMGCTGGGCSRAEYGGLNGRHFARYLEGLPRYPLGAPTTSAH